MNSEFTVENISLILSFIQTIAIIPIFVYLLLRLLLMLRLIIPVRIEVENHHGSEGIVKNLQKIRKISEIEKRKDFIPSSPNLIINISSIITDKSIKIYPQLHIKIVDIETINPGFNQIWYNPGLGYGGGPGYVNEYFNVNISPIKNKIVDANLVPRKGSDGIVDYFVIQPDDIQAFALDIDFEPEFIYTIKVGIEYFYRGKAKITWRGNYKMGKSYDLAKQWGFYSYNEKAEISEYIRVEPENEYLLGK